MSRIRKAIIAMVSDDAQYGNATSRRRIIGLHKKLHVPRKAVASALKSMTASPRKVARDGQLWNVGDGMIELAVGGKSFHDHFGIGSEGGD